jgi:hypothetical protein
MQKRYGTIGSYFSKGWASMPPDRNPRGISTLRRVNASPEPPGYRAARSAGARVAAQSADDARSRPLGDRLAAGRYGAGDRLEGLSAAGHPAVGRDVGADTGTPVDDTDLQH